MFSRARGLPLLLIPYLLGCSATPKIYNFENLGIKIIETDPNTVDRVCGKRTQFNDRGEPISKRIRCCWLPEGIIWMSWTDRDCIIHELCHADGARSRAECDEVH